MKRIFKKSNLFYFIFLNLMIFFKTLGLDGNNKIFIFVSLCSSLFLIMHLFYYKISAKQFFIISIISIICIIITFKSGKITILMSGIIILFTRKIDFDKLIKTIFATKIIGVTMVVLLWICGIVSTNEFYRINNNGELIKRYTLGFIHPNVAFLNFYLLVLMYLYIRFEKLNLKDYIGILTITLLIYRLTDSRTGVISVLIAIILAFVLRYKLLIKFKFIKNIIVLIPLICGIGSVFLCKIYSNNNYLLNSINNILTGRLELGNRFLSIYNIKLLGQKVIEGSSLNGSYLRIDNGYIKLILSYGIVIFIIYIILQIKILKKYTFRTYEYKKVLLIVSFSIYGLTEVYIYNAFINISLLFLSELLYKKDESLDKVRVESDKIKDYERFWYKTRSNKNVSIS